MNESRSQSRQSSSFVICVFEERKEEEEEEKEEEEGWTDLVKASLGHEDALVFRGRVRIVPVGGEPLFEDRDDLLGEVTARLLGVGIQDDGRVRARSRLGLDEHGHERVLVIAIGTAIATDSSCICTTLPELAGLLLVRVKGKTRNGLEV